MCALPEKPQEQMAVPKLCGESKTGLEEQDIQDSS